MRGSVGVAASKGGDVTLITGKQIVADDQYAVTRAASNGLLTFPDSSEIALGPDTQVQVGGFTVVDGGGGAKITLVQGLMRFAVHTSPGAKSNYTFTTPTCALSVRGTVALVQAAANGDTIACLDCKAGDVTVTVGQQQIPLTSGQTLFISLAGVVTAGVIAAAILQAFSGAGLSTAATGSSFAGGVGGSAAAGGAAGSAGAAAGSSAAVAAGAAAAAAAAIAVSNSNAATPTPTQTGTITLTGTIRRAPPTPVPSLTPAPIHR
ncbi:MAG: FecR domain-containing protein [Candidatus Eremiobacteraeota bacterium]|nr:FecR domain-containing protein [Candidatus Eremiobacteraeota bacterium]